MVLIWSGFVSTEVLLWCALSSAGASLAVTLAIRGLFDTARSCRWAFAFKMQTTSNNVQNDTLSVVNVCLGSTYLLLLLAMLAKAWHRVWQCWRAEQHWWARPPGMLAPELAT